MLYYLAGILTDIFGPARLFQSYTVLIITGIYAGFVLTQMLLPKFYAFLPHDRGRDFTLSAEAAKGKPTGSGFVFITFFAVIVFFIVPLESSHIIILILTWLSMLTGFLDDTSKIPWGEYRKGIFDLLISFAAAWTLYFFNTGNSDDGKIYCWLPFIAQQIAVNPVVFVCVSAIIIWISINTTNCSDGVDGLSGTLVLIALITLGAIFYFILGHKVFSAYLLVPHSDDGAIWGIMSFTLGGILMGYLWHNAFPSSVLMGDAGSRALGFFLGACVIKTGNPFLIFAISFILLVNGGVGILKIVLLRFFKLHIFKTVRFPLHDHVRNVRKWSTTQVLIKFVILQILITIMLTGIIFKVR
ncbi:MAG: phospho-N-acetylmuramoyl-pentapeptide-transferase [Treponemataceae bacterium]|nr:MAG: phospho-N-acetylmuramoyl-pentapeptide-transferase [Treponemataceae bacterium]